MALVVIFTGVISPVIVSLKNESKEQRNEIKGLKIEVRDCHKERETMAIRCAVLEAQVREQQEEIEELKKSLGVCNNSHKPRTKGD